MTLFWLSFCDAGRPKGQQFLGACNVEGGGTGDEQLDIKMAVRRAWDLGCNPGGEVACARFPESVQRGVASRWVGRLLTREEAEEFDREMKPHGVS